MPANGRWDLIQAFKGLIRQAGCPLSVSRQNPETTGMRILQYAFQGLVLNSFMFVTQCGHAALLAFEFTCTPIHGQ
jgi:hypothetical protein